MEPSVPGAYVGASGRSYPSWRPDFYPRGPKRREDLARFGGLSGQPVGLPQLRLPHRVLRGDRYRALHLGDALRMLSLQESRPAQGGVGPVVPGIELHGAHGRRLTLGIPAGAPQWGCDVEAVRARGQFLGLPA